jgi:hypothetical protein
LLTAAFLALPPFLAVGFADDGQQQLKYELGSMISGRGGRRRPIALGLQQSAEVSGLPAGEATLYACAIDDAGSELCHFQGVTVTEPESFDAARALAGFSLADAAADTTEALAALSQMFATLVASAASSSNGGGGGAAVQGADLSVFSEEAQMAISQHASNLITLLARKVLVQDSDGAQQVLASVANLAAAVGELLTPAAKEELLEVAQQSASACCLLTAAAAASVATLRAGCC